MRYYIRVIDKYIDEMIKAFNAINIVGRELLRKDVKQSLSSRMKKREKDI